MAITYEKCGADVEELVGMVMKKYHPEIWEAGVTVGLLFADAGVDANGDRIHALKHHGYPAAATIKKISLKDRAAGKCDAEITIDAATWEDLAEEKKVALIDHELNHLILKLDKSGTVDRDDLGRPKLVMRLHDHQLGIFKNIIERHKTNALDYHISKDFTEDMGQLLLWAKDPKAAG